MPNFQCTAEQEFKQIMLLASNIFWLALEWLVLDTSNSITFPIYRLMYFMFVAIIRADSAIEKDNTDLDREDEVITKEMVKTFKVFCYDVASWCLLIWIAGRSIM